ncbi:MAG: oxygen-independent coproporphyrinogen III oxidase [Mariprofundales bacterium]|nr:oxygen-independent coproporphyrinogen III oxidase [Mariprofundales bacterium]
MTQTISDQLFNLDLIHKYDKAGPRYTSYPTAPMFHSGVEASAYGACLDRAATVDAPISLYLHVPFCDTVCYYCGCNKIATKQRQRAVPYVEHMIREIHLLADRLGDRREVSQLHWGGGTPTFLSQEQFRTLMETMRSRFHFLPDDVGEFSIEIDPRECDAAMVALLRELGLNRMSMGVQDFDPAVQKAVNRIQSREETLHILTEARKQGFQSINLDLMYGLPLQTIDSFDTTLNTIIEFSPDRIALFNYAHLPRMFMPQRRIDEAQLPSPQQKLAILKHSIDKLLGAGYQFIGMDHFAKPEDELTIAQREGKLYRNFQGYSTHADADMVGIGITSIGYIDGTFVQNNKTIDGYYGAIDDDKFAVFRGYRLSDEDHLRRHVIMRLMCDFALDFSVVEAAFGINFRDHFSAELKDMAEMAKDGLLDLDPKGINVHTAGRMLIRNIVMPFDAYLREKMEGVTYSKVL